MSSANLLNRAVHLDVRLVRVGFLGYGRIGQAVAHLIEAERDRLIDSGIDLRCTGALVRDLEKRRGGPALKLSVDASTMLRGVDILVEVLGGMEPAHTLVAAALRAGIPVVTANKTMMAGHGQELRALAERHQTALAFDAAVLAGVPFLGSLSRRPLVSAARRIAGVINGTSHYIVGAIERGASYDAALVDAIARGYAEPDSAADTSGRDAAEKLTILLHLAGCRDLSVRDLRCTPLDVLNAADFVCARALDGTIKPIGFANLDPDEPGAWVGPAFVPNHHAFAHITGVTNALQLTGAHGREVVFAGPGAGPDATATTIIDDIVELMSGGFSQSPLPPARGGQRVSASALRDAPPCAWYVRLAHQASRPTDFAERLARSGVVAVNVTEQGNQLAMLTGKSSATAVESLVRTWGAGALALPVI